MKIDCIDEKTKEIILNEIFISEYKEVMRLCMQGISHEQIGLQCGYSTRQVDRIVILCWKEVRIRLAKNQAEMGTVND